MGTNETVSRWLPGHSVSPWRRDRGTEERGETVKPSGRISTGPAPSREVHPVHTKEHLLPPSRSLSLSAGPRRSVQMEEGHWSAVPELKFLLH